EIRGAHAEAADWRRASAALAGLDPSQATRLIERIRRGSDDAADLALAPGARAHLRDIARGGADEAIFAALAGIPRLPRRLIELRAVTPAQAAALVRDASILTLSDLDAALDDGRVTRSWDAAIASQLRRASEALALDAQPLTLGRAADIVEPFMAGLRMSCQDLLDITASGDLRRFEPL